MLPPPIPPRKAEGQYEGSIPPPIPVRSPRRPPGAVATAIVSGQSGQWRLASGGPGPDDEDAEVVEDGTHATNPYDLKAMVGSTVTASYPFHGKDDLQQLSFAVSDLERLSPGETSS